MVGAVRSAAVLAVVIAGCGASVPPVPSRGGPPWIELTSEHFRLWTDGTSARGHQLIREMEHLRQVIVGAVFPTVPAEGRIIVIALRDDYELQAFSLTDEPRAYAMLPHWPMWQPMIVLAADSNQPQGDQTVAHELTHAISWGVVHHQPRWFAEGMAFYLQTVGLDPDRTAVDIGAAPTYRGAPLRLGRLVPLPSLFAWRGMTTDEYPQYSTGFALFAYLFNEHRAELSHYMQLLDQMPTADPAVVWQQAFPSLPIGDTIDTLREWIVHGHHTVLHFTTEPRTWPVTERTLGDGDVYAVRALLRCRDTRCSAAAADLAAALAADPTNVIARVIETGVTKHVALSDARAVVAAHDDSWLAWMLLAEALPVGDERTRAIANACERAARNPAIVPPPGECPRTR